MGKFPSAKLQLIKFLKFLSDECLPASWMHEANFFFHVEFRGGRRIL